ncbi:MAG TPA: hypothetical protein VF534_26125 [Paraburkholderia sp.]
MEPIPLQDLLNVLSAQKQVPDRHNGPFLPRQDPLCRRSAPERQLFAWLLVTIKDKNMAKIPK